MKGFEGRVIDKALHVVSCFQGVLYTVLYIGIVCVRSALGCYISPEEHGWMPTLAGILEAYFCA